MDKTPYFTVGPYGTSSLHHYPSPVSFWLDCSPPNSSRPQTLRLLQPSPITTMQPFYGSNPHTPPTETPQTPNSAHDLPNYHRSTQASVRSYMQMTGAAMAASCDPSVPRPTSPAHVVGSQGRRGILSSAPGRPAAPAAGTPAAKNMRIPAKDTDGKFPCPYCAKTYLHAKHLKRHILRHTGDRPYTCDLCKDDFSRSDILKQHFRKCSSRRVNSTGASHLSNSPPTSRNMHGNQPQLSSSSSMGLVASPANGDRRGGIVNSTNGQNMHDYDVRPDILYTHLSTSLLN